MPEDEVGAWVPRPDGAAGTPKPGAGHLDPGAGGSGAPGAAEGGFRAPGAGALDPGAGVPGAVTVDPGMGPLGIEVLGAPGSVGDGSVGTTGAGWRVGGEPDYGNGGGALTTGGGLVGPSDGSGEPGAGSGVGAGGSGEPGGAGGAGGPVAGKVRAALWPEPGLMHRYLDSWMEEWLRVHDLYQKLEASASMERDRHLTQIATLQRQLDEVRAPLTDRIDFLDRQVTERNLAVARLEAERDDAIKRLAQALEVTPNRMTTLDSLIGNTVILVEESKRAIREHL